MSDQDRLRELDDMHGTVSLATRSWAVKEIDRLRTALERIKDGYRDGPWAGSNWQDGYNCAARVAIKALESGK